MISDNISIWKGKDILRTFIINTMYSQRYEDLNIFVNTDILNELEDIVSDNFHNCEDTIIYGINLMVDMVRTISSFKTHEGEAVVIVNVMRFIYNMTFNENIQPPYQYNGDYKVNLISQFMITFSDTIAYECNIEKDIKWAILLCLILDYDATSDEELEVWIKGYILDMIMIGRSNLGFDQHDDDFEDTEDEISDKMSIIITDTYAELVGIKSIIDIRDGLIQDIGLGNARRIGPHE